MRARRLALATQVVVLSLAGGLLSAAAESCSSEAQFNRDDRLADAP